MMIVGDIGNTETKICLINSNKKIIKRIILKTKKINFNLLKKSILKFKLENKVIKKCLFCSVVPKIFKKIKYFFFKNYNLKCYELKNRS